MDPKARLDTFRMPPRPPPAAAHHNPRTRWGIVPARSGSAGVEIAALGFCTRRRR